MTTIPKYFPVLNRTTCQNSGTWENMFEKVFNKHLFSRVYVELIIYEMLHKEHQ